LSGVRLSEGKRGAGSACCPRELEEILDGADRSSFVFRFFESAEHELSQTLLVFFTRSRSTASHDLVPTIFSWRSKAPPTVHFRPSHPLTDIVGVCRHVANVPITAEAT